jgi:hypothetical protein
MLDNYKKIYDAELKHCDGTLDLLILDSEWMRAFVYEVCKNCIEQENHDLIVRIDSLLSCLKHRHSSVLEKIGEYQEVSEINDLVQQITRKR